MKTAHLVCEPITETALQKKNFYGFVQPCRCLILGASGSGKTTFLVNLMLKNWLDYYRVVIFTKTVYQKCYSDMLEAYKMFNQDNNEKNYKFVDEFLEIRSELVDIDEIKGSNVLIVFDDMLLENQNIIGKYFMLSRHRGFHLVFLAQNYGKVDRQMIKSNLNTIVMFKQPTYYLKSIWQDFFADEKFDDFVERCVKTWCENNYGFIMKSG